MKDVLFCVLKQIFILNMELSILCRQAGQGEPKSQLSQVLQPGITADTTSFMWALVIGTQVLILVWSVLYPLDHLRNTPIS